MKVNLFTLCDGAFNYNGKLTIVGTYDNLKIARLPGKADVSVALKLEAANEESGNKTIVLKLQDNDSVDVVGSISLNTQLTAGEVNYIAAALTIHGVQFSKPGAYHALIFDGDNCLLDLVFHVSD